MLQSLKNIYLLVRYYLFCNTYRIILKSGCFDSDYYKSRVPGLENSKKNPLIHYVDFGADEGKSPSPFFDPVFYKSCYDFDSTVDPFVHYLTVGAAAGHRPCAWFDPEFYSQQYLTSVPESTIPLQHYQKQERRQELYANREIFSFPRKPLLSIIVPVYNVSSFHLINCIQSVVNQSYPHWELCLADDCSSKSHVRPLLRQWVAKDSRIKVLYLEKNSGISAASNAAASLASGDYLGFLDNDDELAVECLSKMVAVINEKNAELYYTDEDLIGEDGRQFSVFHKPDFNPELLLCHNYITHFVLADAELFKNVGGFDAAKDGAQDHDLLLKMSEQAKGIIHIPEVLYHWRASDSSTSINHKQKSYADEAGRKSVEGALQRREIQGWVDSTDWKFFYSVRRKIDVFPVISVVIIHRKDMNFRSWLVQLAQSCSYPAVEIFIIQDSAFTDEESDRYDLDGMHIHQLSTKQSIATSYNEAVKQCTGEYVVFLDAGIEIQSSTWLEGLLEQCIADDVGMAGGMMVPLKGEYSITTVPDLNNDSDSYYSTFVQDCSRHMNGLQCTQNVCSLSWHFMMVDRSRFLEVGGFDEHLFPNLFADIDLCFRMREAGYTLVYSPFAVGKWTVSEEQMTSLSEEANVHAKKQFQQKWNHFLTAGDPFYNSGVVKQAGIDLPAFRKWYTGEC